MSLMILLMLVGSYANAATVLVGNGISWTSTVTNVGADTGTITLIADVSGASFGWGSVGHLSGIGIKNLGNPDSSPFSIKSIELVTSPLKNWSANNDELNSSGTACNGGGPSASKRACAFATTGGDRISTADGPLTIVLGVEFDSGVIGDSYHFKVRWEDLRGDHTGSHISDDFSTVPLPAAAWLFGSALVGMVVVARRRDLRNRTPVA
jgi:hypothetical protein